MAYIFDPIRNTFVDDEDTSLGNKLALNDEEFEKLLKIPGVFRASEAMQPPPRQEVLDREAINRFIRDNKAQGGRVNLQNGLGVMTLDPFKPTINPIDSGRLENVLGVGIPIVGGASLLEKYFKKKTEEDKKNIIPSDDKIPGTEPPEGPDFTELSLEVLREAVKDRDYNKEGFFKNINKYSKEKHGGNLKRAIADLINTTDPKKINNFYSGITQAAKRKNFKFDAVGGRTLKSDIPVSKVPLDFKDFTTQLRTDTSVLDNRVKELKLDKYRVLYKIELFDAKIL